MSASPENNDTPSNEIDSPGNESFSKEVLRKGAVKKGAPRKKKGRKRSKSKKSNYTEGSAFFNQRTFAIFSAIVTLGFIVFLIWSRSGKPRESEVVAAVEQSNADKILDTFTPAKVLELTRILPAAYKELEFPLKAQELESRVETLEKLRTKGLNAELHGECNRMLLRYYGLYDGLFLEEGLDRVESKKRVMDFANLLLADPDAKTVSATKYTLIAISLEEMKLNLNRETYDNVVRVADENIDGTCSDSDEAQSIAQLVFNLSQMHPSDPLADKIQTYFGEKLSSRSDQEIQSVGLAILENQAFGGVDLQALRDQIALNIGGADVKFGKVLQALESFPNASTTSYAKLLAANESLICVGKYDDAKNVANYLLRKAEKVADENTVRFIDKAIARQKQRIALVGKEFDLTGSTFDGQEIATSSEFTVIVFWSLLDRKSAASMEIFVKTRPKTADSGFRILGACSQKFTPKVIQEMRNVQTEVLFCSDETTKKLSAQCPVDLMPYILVVDPDQKVIAMNVPISSLNFRMKQIMINSGRTVR
jgi:hypothetical protein